MGFPRQECWDELPFPSAGDLPDPGIKPTSLALAGGFFTTEPPGKPFPALGFGLCRVGENTLTKVVPVLVSLSQITLGSLKFSKGCGNEFIKITSMEELQSFSEKRYRFEQLLLASLGVGREENGRE